MSRRRWLPVPAPRRVLLGLVAVVLGVAAHAGAGGTVSLDPTTLAAALLAGTAAAAGAGAGPLSPPRAAVVLGAGQLALHAALGGAPTHDMAAMAPMAPMAGGADPMHAHVAPATGAAAVPAWTDAPMLASHVAVVLLVAALCSGADRAVVRLLATLRRSVADAAGGLVRALARPLLPIPGRVVVVGAPISVDTPVGVVVARTHRRRGPPVPSRAPVTPGGRPAGPDPTSERTP